VYTDFDLESLRRICVLGRLFRIWNLSRTSLDVYVFLGLGIGFGFGLGGVFLCCILGLSFPSFFFSFVNRLFGTWRILGPLFVFSSLPPFLLGLFTLFGTPWAKGGVLARDLARWLLWRMGAYSPQRPPLASPAPTSLAYPHAEE
jgi:hypothetical protein